MTKKNQFPILVAVALVLMIIMGFWIYSNYPSSTREFESDIKELETQSTSNTVDSIEEDLNNTDLSDIDKELDDIEKELIQAY
jgi:hypothetical protein